jgi:hypothetical protein
MRKIDLSYYLLLFVFAPFIPVLLTLLTSFNLNYTFAPFGDKIVLLLLALILTLSLTRLTGSGWQVALAFLWALGQHRILTLGLMPVTMVWKSLGQGQGLQGLLSASFIGTIIALAIYFLLLFFSLRIARLKGRFVLKFLILAQIIYQLGFRLIQYKI